MYKSIELFYEPRAEIINKINPPEGEPEMTEFESAFLCGVLRQFKPYKILEIGVAGGGTTAIIMQCMHMLGLQYELHSVDLEEIFYRNPQYATGFLGVEAKKYIDNTNQVFHLGKLSTEFMDEIGGNIDCIIIDTIHALPGEVLDFLAWYPKLSKNAILILHDLAGNYTNASINNRSKYKEYADATKRLFDCLKGNKYYMKDDSVPERNGLPNIGAVQLAEDTYSSIQSVIGILTETWFYFPQEIQLQSYLDSMSLWMDEECRWLLDSAVNVNRDISQTKYREDITYGTVYSINLKKYLHDMLYAVATNKNHRFMNKLYKIYKKRKNNK